MKNRINSKDLISVGIFTTLILLIACIAPAIGAIPGMYLMRTPAVALLCGPIYLLYISKVGKPFCIIITGVICGGVMGLLSFGSVTMFLLNVICFVLAEITASIGKYKSKLWNSLSYIVLGFWTFAQDGAFWYMKDFMISFTNSINPPEGFLDGILTLITPQNLVFVLVVTLFFSILSVIFSNMLLKKHFKKAGLV